MAACKSGAKRNAMPTSSRQSPRRSGARSILTPSAFMTSALPEALLTPRLPCLATLAPAPQATSAEAVEMLNVPLRSPPVPQVSMTSVAFVGMRVTFSRMTSAHPATSSGVSPFRRNATRNPAICASVACPDMIACMAASASALGRSSPSISFEMTSLIMAPPASLASTSRCPRTRARPWWLRIRRSSGFGKTLHRSAGTRSR